MSFWTYFFGGGGETSVTPGVGSVVMVGFDPTVTLGLPVNPGTGSVLITGLDPAITDASDLQVYYHQLEGPSREYYGLWGPGPD